MPLVDRSGGSWRLARLVLLLSLPIMTWTHMEDGWDGSCLSLAFAAIGKWRCGMEDKDGGARERSIGQTTSSLFFWSECHCIGSSGSLVPLLRAVVCLLARIFYEHLCRSMASQPDNGSEEYLG